MADYTARVNLNTTVLDFAQFGRPKQSALLTFRWEVTI